MDAAEMVGAMKFFERAAALGVRTGTAWSRGSFSFSPKEEEERDLRCGEGEDEAWWHPHAPPLGPELLCDGQSAGLKGLESALRRMAGHGLAAAGDGDGDLATAAILPGAERERERDVGSRRGGEEGWCEL